MMPNPRPYCSDYQTGAVGDADGFVTLDGVRMYRIADLGRMGPFLMSIVSDSDHWTYVSSTGGLTCGRGNEDGSLFPYRTDDLLHRCAGRTGPWTLLAVQRGGGPRALWEPFTGPAAAGQVRRSLLKSVLGNQVVFEECRPDLALTFRYRWAPSEAFGFVRTATLINDDPAAPVRVALIDGLLDVLPAGAELVTQQRASCLLNAYTQCELDDATGMMICSQTSRITDKAEPAEALTATVAWCRGLPGRAVLLSDDQVAAFREGRPVRQEERLTGRRGAFLVHSGLELPPGGPATWDICADVGLGHLELARLRQRLLGEADLAGAIRADIAAGSENLRRIVASADGLQATADEMATTHHLANVLFNNMRGGVFEQGGRVPVRDFAACVAQRNAPAAAAHAALLAALDGDLDARDLLARLGATGDADLIRLGHEYLPLWFGRRHGDPSRPWNRFDIRIRNADGSRALSYQGNWRDVFQNWEALCLSFPQFLESILAKLVNASTVDGFNPYRVMREGIEWEVSAPHDPWSHIGYWGDHQVIYLLKFLEWSRRYHPGALEGLLKREAFSYADVPYRIKSYEEMLRDPRRTIDFDHEHHRRIEDRVREVGADGKLLCGPDGRVHHVNLVEKLLVTALSKLSNLLVDGGIWMNTQRPEWNDANNALVGYGVSMVTHCYLRRYAVFCRELLAALAGREVALSREVAEWLDDVLGILGERRGLLAAPQVADGDRKRMLDELGLAFQRYRDRAYRDGLSRGASRPAATLLALFDVACEYLDHGIRASRRDDGLYHAYNLLAISADGREAKIERLYEMLEGQVAVLSSGVLSAEQSADLLEALFASRMYRPDQRSFMLYPERRLPAFMDRNVVPVGAVEANPLLRGLIQAGERSVIARDAAGVCRFHSGFRNAEGLRAALDKLAQQERWAGMVAAHRRAVLNLYEDVFHHRAFTGRSGTMYGYEGLGCIYWHMVAKLLVAAQECWGRAVGTGAAAATVRRLADLYYRVREGLGFHKTAAEYGAFPADPYSHTPRHAGAQQPGMTGQVKEEIITRLGELGVVVEAGRVAFRPRLLRQSEFLTEPRPWEVIDSDGAARQIDLPAGSLGFTFCQVPVIYILGGKPGVTVELTDGSTITCDGDTLDAATSAALFARTGRLRRITVTVLQDRMANDETRMPNQARMTNDESPCHHRSSGGS